MSSLTTLGSNHDSDFCQPGPVWSVCEPHTSEILQSIAFCVQFLLPNIMSVKTILVCFLLF